MNYFKFGTQIKHPGIVLSEDFLEATFKKNLPSRPAAIVQNPIQEDHTRFAFEIKKLEKTAFIFAATTVFIGICNPTTVKAVGMRRIS